MDNNGKDLPFGIMTGILQDGTDARIGIQTIGGPLLSMTVETAAYLTECLMAHLDVLGYDPEDEGAPETPEGALKKVLH